MNIVLGCGIAGCLIGFYKKNFKVIGKIQKNIFTNNFPLGPQLLYDTKEIRDLLYDLNLNVYNDIVHVGYYNGKEYKDIINDNFKQKYSLITRNKKEYESSFLSDGRNSYSVLRISNNKEDFKFLLQSLYKVLKKRNQIIDDWINNIDIIHKTISLKEKSCINYNQIFNTIPLNVFLKLSNIEFKCFDFKLNYKHFYKCTYNNDLDKELKYKYDYIYSINNLYTRKTYYENFIIYETVDKIYENTIDSNSIVDKKENLKIQIINNVNFKSINDIIMIGRYAQWNHKIRLNEIIKKIKKVDNER